jgi:hypothetical protein
MSVNSIPATAATFSVDTSIIPQTVLLPLSQQKVGRVITIADSGGSANINPITISTQVANLFQTGSNIYVISSPYQSYTFISKNNSLWSLTGSVNPPVYTSSLFYNNISIYQNIQVNGNLYVAGGISSPTISTIQGNITNSSNYFNTVNANALAIAGTISASLTASILNSLQTNPILNSITVLSLNSTLQGLGTLGYISTPALIQTSNYFRGTLQNWSTAVSSVANFTSNTSNFFRNTSNYYKGLTIFDVSTAIISTGKIVGSGGSGGSTLSSLFVGAQSTQNFIKFWGKTGEYNNTVIAEQSTGNTTGELMMFKGSSVADQFRFQTTGRMLFETGVSSRNFDNAPQLSTATMIITANSNVGILTNNPIYTLDVAGTGRFQTSLTVGSLSLGIYFA